MFHGSGWFAYLRAEDQQPRKISRQVFWRTLAYAKPYWQQIAALLFLILLSSALSVITPLIFRSLIDEVLPAKDTRRLGQFALLLLALPLLNGGLAVLQRYLNARIGEGVIFDLRVALFEHLQRMSLRFFTHTKVGELMSRLNNDVVGAQNAISNTLVNLITNFIQAGVLLAMMLSLEWRLTLASILILPLFILAARKLGGLLREIARRQMEVNAQMNAHANETLNIGGAMLVKLFGRWKDEMERFRRRAESVREMGVRRAVIGASFFMLVGLISALGVALVYSLGGWLVIQGRFTIGTIVAFGAYLTSLYNALQGLASAPVEFSTSMVSFERVFEVLDLPVDIPEPVHPRRPSSIRGDLTFESVSFRYEAETAPMLREVKRFGSTEMVSAVLSLNQDNLAARQRTEEAGETKLTEGKSQARWLALEEISFTAKAGELVAIVGPSGAGKTTLTYLIPRLYDPTEGRILLDGIDLRELSLETIAATIGMVTQEPHLFHDTIRTNLLYAKPNATQREIEAAAQAANIHDFIRELPQGYDTIVGERGYRLSGGEKQRIALARVILKDPRILVLDEATSHLDSESEVLIQEALKRVFKGRTSIVIAHRLSTILAADKILVLDRGRIVEQGNHAQLLQQNGLYAHLFETQFRAAMQVPAPGLP
jgi:ATP-binding cassette subfamily B protein